MMSERVNPLGDLADFQPKLSPASPRPSADKVDAVASAHGFPSRDAAKPIPQTTTRRRFRTGRNQQINIKASADTIARMTRIADALNLPLGAILEKAIEALEQQQTR
jgi:hypothetical protein